jgi:hypothetical protein
MGTAMRTAIARRLLLVSVAAAQGLALSGCGKDPPAFDVHAVRINEVNPHNVSWEDTWGGTGDWIELFNSGPEPVDLAGYYISDSAAKRYKYQFEMSAPDDAGGTDSRVLVPARDVLLLWADNQTNKSTPLAPHLNFALSATGEGVWLSDPSGYVIDSVDFGEVPKNPYGSVDTSLARFPDGTGPFQWCAAATPERLNGSQCALP